MPYCLQIPLKFDFFFSKNFTKIRICAEIRQIFLFLAKRVNLACIILSVNINFNGECLFGFKFAKKKRTTSKKRRKSFEIRPDVKSPTVRCYLLRTKLSVYMECNLALKIKNSADKVGLSIGCYIRSQLEQTMDHILGEKNAERLR